MAAADAKLFGATFKGKLTPPGAASAGLTYVFGDAVLPGTLNQKVKRQRQILRWSTAASVQALNATCSIPTLGLQNEPVVVSVDPAGEDGSYLILLQSLQRPELGLTILRLDADGEQLTGGEEGWKPGDPVLIAAKRSGPTSPKSKAGTPKSAASVTKAPSPTAAKKVSLDGYASPDVVAMKVTPGPMIFADPDAEEPEQDIAAERWAFQNMKAAAAQSYAPVEGGVGRMGMKLTTSKTTEQGKAKTGNELMRPDALTAASNNDWQTVELETIERLVAAAGNGELGDVKQHLARVGPDRLSPPDTKYAGLTALMVAAYRGRDEVLEAIIEQKANLDLVDERGWPAISHAVHGQRPSAVKALIAARANANIASAAVDNCVTPLMLASSGARAELVAFLISGKAQKEIADAEGRRALHYAAKSGRGGALSHLLSAGAMVDAADFEGLTPLLAAAASGRAEAVKILINNRANLDAKDRDEHSAVDLAMSHERVLDALKEAAANKPNWRTR